MGRKAEYLDWISLERQGLQDFYENKIKGLVLSLYEDEKPLQGLIGLLDWRFQGVISEYLKNGALSGSAGECAYIPLHKADRTFHLIIVGRGKLEKNGKRSAIPEEGFKALSKNLLKLRLEPIGVSASDLGISEPKHFHHLIEKNLHGLDLKMLP